MPIPSNPEAALRLIKNTLRTHDNWSGSMGGTPRDDTRRFDVEAVRILVHEYERLKYSKSIVVDVRVDVEQVQAIIDSELRKLGIEKA